MNHVLMFIYSKLFNSIAMLVVQVYIIRANKFTTADGAISLLNLEVHKKGKLSSKYVIVEFTIKTDFGTWI